MAGTALATSCAAVYRWCGVLFLLSPVVVFGGGVDWPSVQQENKSLLKKVAELQKQLDDSALRIEIRTLKVRGRLTPLTSRPTNTTTYTVVLRSANCMVPYMWRSCVTSGVT